MFFMSSLFIYAMWDIHLCYVIISLYLSIFALKGNMSWKKIRILKILDTKNIKIRPKEHVPKKKKKHYLNVGKLIYIFNNLSY